MERNREVKAHSLVSLAEMVTNKTIQSRNWSQIERDCNKTVCTACPNKIQCKKCTNYTVMPKGTIQAVAARPHQRKFSVDQIQALLKALNLLS